MNFVSSNPIFIIAPNKSGGSLLRALFDGHPDLFVIPIECHFFWHAGCWIDYPFRNSRPPLQKGKELRQRFSQWIDNCNQSEHRYADSITKNQWDMALVEEVLNATPTSGDETLRDEIALFVKAMWYALGHEYSTSSSSIRFVEKSVENAEMVPLIKDLFPDAHFIHVLRNPYANLVSFRRVKTRKGRLPFLIPLLRSLYISYYHLYRNRQCIPNYYVIRYEDLVQEPKVVMSELAARCSLDFDEVLLQPSSLGKSWAGNSSYDEEFDSISQKPLTQWRSEVFDFEITFVNKLFEFVLCDFGYDTLNPRESLWKPMHGESLKTYLKNRLFFKTSRHIF